jgi:hypothetical protein
MMSENALRIQAAQWLRDTPPGTNARTICEANADYATDLAAMFADYGRTKQRLE